MLLPLLRTVVLAVSSVAFPLQTVSAGLLATLTGVSLTELTETELGFESLNHQGREPSRLLMEWCGT